MKHDSKRKARRCVARPGGRLDWRRAAFLAMLVCPWAWGETGRQNVLPAGFNLKSGSVATPTTASNSLTIIQSSSRAVIEWSNFSIGAGKSVTFTVPNKSAITLSKVVGTQPSNIEGTLTSNGQVWLLNPSGVLIGRNGSINTAGFLASTHQLWDTSNNTGLTDSAFLTAGNSFALANPGFGQIVNQGSITATNGGYVILAGREVRNEGSISAMGGQIALGAGNSVNISFNNDKLLSFAVSGEPDTSGTVTNLGSLVADGGKIWLSARDATNVATAVINTSGTVQAKTASNVNGEIVLDGGDSKRVEVKGVLDVRGMNTGQSGGAIKIYGNQINVAASTKLDARGDAGGGTISVGGGTISVGGGPSIPPAASVSIGTNAELNASAINSGNGGSVVVESAMTNPLSMTRVLGSLFATGGNSGGNGGTIVTRGFGLEAADAKGSAKAQVAGGAPGSWEFAAVGLGVGQAPSIGGGTPPPASITGAQIGDLLNDGTAVSINSMSGARNDNPIPGNLNVWDKIEITTGPRDVVLQLNAVNDVVINAGIENKGGGKLGINLRADSDGNGAGEVTVANGQYLRSGGGDIKLGGGLDLENGYARNIKVLGEISAGGGSLTMRGSGPASGGAGVIVGSTAAIEGAEISINGRGQAPSDTSAPMPEGVRIEGGAQISGANISIDATGVTIGEAQINSGSNLTVQAQGGDVLIGNLVDPANLRPAELGARLTISDAKSIKGFVKDGITIGGLAATGAIKFATKAGDLTLAGNVTTGDTTPNAITLIAGQNASAGDASGGNIIMQGTPTITTGAGGRVRLYTGSISDSTGLVDFAGSGSGNFRYNSTLQSTGFTAPLGPSGKFVIYRERPTLTLIAPSGTFQPGANISLAPQVVGLRNGDSPIQALGPVPRVDVEGPHLNGYLMPGDHVTKVAPQSVGPLGYDVRYAEGKVTITPPKETTTGQQIANTTVAMNNSAQNQSGLGNGFNNSAPKGGQGTMPGGSNQSGSGNGNPPGKTSSDSTTGQTQTNASGDNPQLDPNPAGHARRDPPPNGSTTDRKPALDQSQSEVAADNAPQRAASNDKPADKPKDETAPTQTTAAEKTDKPASDAPAERSAANDKPTDKPKDERVATQPSASPDKPAATTTASAAATLVAKVERTSTLTVAAPPPSPVPQEKPPTPRDTADSADRTLAAANTPAPPKPAPQARRQAARKVEVSQGLVAVQPATRAASTAGAPRDPRISMNGNTGKW